MFALLCVACAVAFGDALSAPRAPAAAPAAAPKAWQRRLLDSFIESDIYRAWIVPRARATMRKTAEENDVQWGAALDWIASAGPWDAPTKVAVPDYYDRPFHAYDKGNMCFEAAWEQEIASKAVGARNYPAFGAGGEDAFRGAFDDALDELGAAVPDGGVVVDLGCGTGVSTRRLASRYPGAGAVRGVELSPYMVAVADRLFDLANEGRVGADWVNTIVSDSRVDFVQASMEDYLAAHLAEADVIVLSLVVHELPPAAACAVVEACLHASKPGAQLWIYDMDFDTPGFTNLRANPMLFSLIRSTEPWLDDYADYGVARLAEDVRGAGYGNVRLRAATGRHFALVATAGNGAGVDDKRLETRLPDTHLQTWQASEK
ncbi:S-adenosyl-L-methionine-dependent methyltransferase [Pelagophyceae sp. CCMP2097]|nr:S-adenosyl-L-methionine-dependent methyltransferase [Pelagophyceae sp. CCMP2097]|mmetsp:Transcript_10367/g.34319  ORF Transcript_10367/g.34319 Transcript_10367/m.34319 type:complete len:375 (+) Transcript_10367:348-1472(+)